MDGPSDQKPQVDHLAEKDAVSDTEQGRNITIDEEMNKKLLKRIDRMVMPVVCLKIQAP